MSHAASSRLKQDIFFLFVRLHQSSLRPDSALTESFQVHLPVLAGFCSIKFVQLGGMTLESGSANALMRLQQPQPVPHVSSEVRVVFCAFGIRAWPFA